MDGEQANSPRCPSSIKHRFHLDGKASADGVREALGMFFGINELVPCLTER
jgi:hypothetical protein